MLNAIRRSVGMQVSRFRFRKTRDKVMSFSRSFTDARDVLVVMPFDRGQLLKTVFVIDLLRKTFHEENLTFVTTERNQELRRMMPRSQFIPVSENDRTVFHLPRPALLQRVNRKPYDLAVDLNLDFLLPSAYICKATNARVRIGLAKKRGDMFFNFQVRTGAEQGGKDVYERLATCLQMF